MKAYSSMKPAEFIDQIRDALIRAKVPPLVIDQVDKLHELKTQDEFDEELEKLAVERDDAVDKLDCATNERQALLEALTDLLDGLSMCDADKLPSMEIERAEKVVKQVELA